MSNGSDDRKEWGSSFGFIIACVGSAVGLGNIWKFPYIAYENGGGAFVLVYLLAVIFVGFPIIVAEMALGRSTQHNVFGAFKELSGNSIIWKTVGIACVFSTFAVLSYYSVVAGWTLDYFISSVTGSLQHLDATSVGDRFGTFVGNPWKQVAYHSIFMFLTGFIVIKGTERIEKSVKILMPVLGVLVLVIAGISTYNYGASQSLNFLFDFDFSKLTPHAVLEAVGHAFFTLSLGFGAMVVYGSYLPKGTSLVKSSIWIAVLDTLIAMFACMMMYPIIFGTKIEVSESAAILFTTLTVQFNALPGGSFISALFYMLVAFAALSSTISLLEIVVAFVDETFNVSRKKGTIIASLAIWFVGLGSALGNGAVKWITDLKIMDRLDYLTSNWLLPVCGMLIAIFMGWVVKRQVKMNEFLPGFETSKFYPWWNFSIKFISPVLVVVVVLYKIGLFS